MAIYHHSVSIVKRSAGKSAVAAAAYRAGQKLTDERTGLIHDYRRKSGVDHSEIIIPEMPNTDSNWLLDRSELWNRIEAGEKRYDARVARQVTLAIPIKLTRDSQIELVRDYIQANYTDRGMVADVNFHDLQSNNPHCHIMLTMRSLIVTDGRVEFGNKNRDWDNRALLLEQRQSWETLANKYLSDAGYDRVKVDCRSLEAQGINRIPQLHLGTHVSQMKARGVSTRIGDEYDRINLANAKIKSELEDIYNDRLLLVDLDEQCKSLHAKIRSLETRDLNYFEKVDPDVLARINSENQTRKYPTSVDREDLISSIGGNDRVQRIAHWCCQNMIIPDGQHEFKRESNSISAKMSARTIDSGLIAYVFTDVIQQDSLTIGCDKTSGEIMSVSGLATGAIIGLLNKIDDQVRLKILRDLSKTKTQAEPKIDNPEIDKAETLTTPITLITPDRVSESETIQIEMLAEIDTTKTTTASEQVTTKNHRKTTPRRRSNALE